MVYNALILCIYDKLYTYIHVYTHIPIASRIALKEKSFDAEATTAIATAPAVAASVGKLAAFCPGIPSWSCGRSNRLLQWWFHQQTCGNMRMQPTKKVMYNDAIYNSYWSTGWWFGTWLLFFHWEFHHPNWRTHVCQRGWNHQTVLVYIYTNISIPKCRDIPWHTYIYIFVWVSTINLYITIYDG